MDQVSKYFNTEKAESLLFILTGFAAILIAIYFLLKIKTPFHTGMVYPLIGIALIQLTVGTSVYFRSPQDITRVNMILKNDPAKIKTEEIPRMETVMKNFAIYRWVEISLLSIGIVLLLSFPSENFWRGFGAGLTMQSALMLLLDYFAEDRGKAYIDFLKNL